MKLMTHTIKLWEKVIEHRLRLETRIVKNQFDLMLGRFTIEVIFILYESLSKSIESKRLIYNFCWLEKNLRSCS